MARTIALHQTNSNPRCNAYTHRVAHTTEILIDGQCIDEQGERIARRRALADRREERLLNRNAHLLRLGLSVVNDLPLSAAQQQVMAALREAADIADELLIFDSRENRDHNISEEYWQDSRQNRRSACAVLDGLGNSTAVGIGTTNGGNYGA